MRDELPDFVPLDSLPSGLGTVTRADVIAEARSWLDTKYVHQHRAKGHGVDCAGLVIGVAHELHLVEPEFDVTGYERTPDGVSLLAWCDKYMTRVALQDVQPGHVLVIRWEVDPQHIGIVGDYLYGGLSLIHALGTSDGKGRVVEHRIDAKHRSRAIAAFAIPGVV